MALVLHTDGARLHAIISTRGDRLRLHGRTVGVRRRADGAAASAKRELFAARRPGVHRRPDALRGEARTAPERSRVSEQRRRRALRAGAPNRGAIPPTRRAIPHPRLGFFGVIDERMDLALLDGVAAARPDWHLVLLGPVAKIDPASLPRAPNIHYLGPKQYARAAALHRRLGRRDAAVRAQRGDALHQPDEDAGIPGRRASRSCRRRFATSCARTASRGWCGSPTPRGRSSQACSAAHGGGRREAAARGRRVPRADVVGRHVDAHAACSSSDAVARQRWSEGDAACGRQRRAPCRAARRDGRGRTCSII